MTSAPRRSSKHADMIEPDRATIPYPPLTKDFVTKSN